MSQPPNKPRKSWPRWRWKITKKKPRKFKPENQWVELTTVEVRLVMDEGEVGHGRRTHSIFGSLRRRSRCRNWSKSWTETTVWRSESRWRRCIWRRWWSRWSSRRSQGKGWVAAAAVLLNILLLLLLCLFWFRGLGLWIWGFTECLCLFFN